MPHQFPRFLDRESWSHTLEDSPQCAKSSQPCIPKSPVSFNLAPLPLLCLHSIKALHFPGGEGVCLIFVFILKLNYYYFLMHQHYPMCSLIYKIDYNLEKAYKACGTMLQARRDAPQARTWALKLVMHKFRNFIHSSAYSGTQSSNREPPALLHPLPPNTGPCREMHCATGDVSPEQTRIHDGMKN